MENAKQVQFRKSVRHFNTPHDAHFLTFSCFRRQQFLKSRRPLEWLSESVTKACIERQFALWGYVFMPEHVHLLISANNDEYDVSSFLHFVKQSVTNKARAFAKSSDKPRTTWDAFLDLQPSGRVYFRFWQRGSGYDVNVAGPDHAREVLEYMHNNPVKRELCHSPAEWNYSSAAHYLGHGEGPVPVTTAPI